MKQPRGRGLLLLRQRRPAMCYRAASGARVGRAEDVAIHHAKGQQADQRHEDEDERARACVDKPGLVAGFRLGRAPLPGVRHRSDSKTNSYKKDDEQSGHLD